MKKNLLAIALGSVIALTAAPYSLAANDSTIQSSADYSQLVTKRQVVDQLLNDAVEAFKSPARISHAGFTAKMPSNMEMVTDRLLEAYQLEPYRTDLLISAANAQIYNKNVDRAIELFEQALAVAPDDVDLHAYLAVWQRFKGNQTESDQHMTTLAKLNAGKAADIKRIFDTVDRVLATSLKEKADKGKLDDKGASDCYLGLCAQSRWFDASNLSRTSTNHVSNGESEPRCDNYFDGRRTKEPQNRR